MLKKTKLDQDEINLIHLAKIFLDHKYKFLLMGILGIFFSLFYSPEEKIIFKTTFIPSINHPFIDNEILLESKEVQELLNKSRLNNKVLPNYKFHPKIKGYSVLSKNKIEEEEIISLLQNALKNQLEKYIAFATKTDFSSKKGALDSTYIAFLNGMQFQRKISAKLPFKPLLSIKDISSLNIDRAVDSLSVSFGPTVSNKKNQTYKKLLFGFLTGLILGFFWMLGSITRKNFKES